jgi:PAS domain S-box-containing protein
MITDHFRRKRKSQRARMEQELRRRGAQFETLLNEAPLGVFLVDADLRIQQVNPIAAAVFARIDASVIGRDFDEVIHLLWPAHDADEILSLFRHTLDTGESWHEPERAVLRPDSGQLEYYEWDIDRIQLPDGRFGVVCYFSDVSDYVNTRLAIARSEARYRALFESIEEGFCILQLIFNEDGKPCDYRFIETNPAFVKQSSLAGAVGRTARELMPDIEPSWIESYGNVALSGEPARFTNYSRTLDRWFDVDAFRIGDAEERRVAALFRDITAHKRAEAAFARELRDHRRLQEISCRLIPAEHAGSLFRELLEAAIVLTQADRGTIQSLDEKTRELCLLESQGIPQQVRESSARIRMDASTACAEAARRGQRVIVDYLADERLAGTDVARAHLEMGIRLTLATPLVTRSGGLVGIITTHWNQPHEISERSLYMLDILARQAADLIERGQAEASLRDADRRKDEFLATLAHELRNPLAAIRTAVGALGDKNNGAAHAEMTAVIDRQSDRLARLVDDLLDVSRITRGKMTLRRMQVDIGKIVRQVVVDSSVACEEKDLKVTAAIPEQPILVHADPVRIAQVLANLVQNSCQFTPRGGEIRFMVGQEGGTVRVRLADTGIGMTSEQAAKIFEMFAQVGEAPGHRTGGLGIGLALARSIVELHGGRIEAKSAGPGKGSEFLISLPAVEAADVVDDPAADDAPPEPLENAVLPRVVLADDNLDALHAMGLVLRAKGYEVTTAVDGADALSKLRAFRPDVALLDIGMPLLDGYEVARRVRQEPWGQDMLLVAVTGWGQDRDRQEAEAAGFDLHLTKPVSLATLERMMAAPVRAAGDGGSRQTGE